MLHLYEYDPITQQYTGQSLYRLVTYVLRDWPGLMPGYAVMGLAELETPQDAAEVAQDIVSDFGVAILRQRLQEGCTVEIPSLGITLTKADIQGLDG